MTAGSRVARSQREMVDALRKHLRLLEEQAHRLFIDRDLGYAGEVAGKLRLLACRFRSNEPLLLRLIEETGADISIHLDSPPIPLTASGLMAGDPISLAEYLQLDALWIRAPSGELTQFTKTRLIRAWAEQSGAPHEDWSMDEGLRAALAHDVTIMGMPAAVAELRTTCDAVIDVARRFLEGVDTDVIRLTGDDRTEAG